MSCKRGLTGQCVCRGVRRSVREAGAVDERQEDQKEEVDDQEVHAESVLQRVILVRSGV